MQETYSRPAGRLSVTTTPEAGSPLGLTTCSVKVTFCPGRRVADVGQLGQREIDAESELLDDGITIATAVGRLERIHEPEAIGELRRGDVAELVVPPR